MTSYVCRTKLVNGNAIGIIKAIAPEISAVYHAVTSIRKLGDKGIKIGLI